MNEKRTGLRLRHTEQIRGHCVTQSFRNGQPDHGGHSKTFDVIPST
jgi:hypothetical protein